MSLDIPVLNKNTGFAPVPGFNFMLRVEMAFDVPVKSVRAFSKNYEYEYIQEGGLNDYVHMRRKPISQPFTFEVERYAATDLYYDPLQNGTELMLPLLLMVSPTQGEFWGYSRRTFAFSGCTVIGKEYGQLDAERGALLTEVIKIAYRQVAVIDLPETIVAEKKNYLNELKGPNAAKVREEGLYGRQKDDNPYQTHLATHKTNKNEAAFINSENKEKFTGSLKSTRAFSTFNYHTGEVGTKEKEEANARYYKTDYGKFDGLQSAGFNAYLEGEVGKDLDANAAEYKFTGGEDPKTGNLMQVRSNSTFDYLKGEVGTGTEENAKEGEDSDTENLEQARWLRDEPYNTLIKKNKTTNKNAAAYKFKESEDSKKGNLKQVRSNSTFDYIGREKGAKPDANKRSYPDDESYYGKEILDNFANNAKSNARTWPPTESAFGIEQMKNKGKK